MTTSPLHDINDGYLLGLRAGWRPPNRHISGWWIMVVAAVVVYSFLLYIFIYNQFMSFSVFHSPKTLYNLYIWYGRHPRPHYTCVSWPIRSYPQVAAALWARQSRQGGQRSKGVPCITGNQGQKYIFYHFFVRWLGVLSSYPITSNVNPGLIINKAHFLSNWVGYSLNGHNLKQPGVYQSKGWHYRNL